MKLFKIIIVAFLLAIIAQGGVAQRLTQRLEKISEMSGLLVRTYSVIQKPQVSVSYPKQRSLTRLQSTVGSSPGIQAQGVSQSTSSNPSVLYFPNPEGSFSYSVLNRTVLVVDYVRSLIPESRQAEGFMREQRPIIIERRVHQPLIGKANSGTELLSVHPPTDFPGRPLNQKPFRDLYPTSEFLFNKAFNDFKHNVESLSYYPIAESIDLSHNLAQCKYYFKSKNHNALPAVFRFRNSRPYVTPPISLAIKKGKAIVAIHCDNNHPSATYYTLVWYPGDPRYTFTNMMLHLSRVHDYSTLISFYPLASISESIKDFESNLENISATVCSPGITENLRVVWSTIEDMETTPA